MASAESVSPLNDKRSLRRAMNDRRTQHPMPERQRAARAAARRLLDLPELQDLAARRGCLAGFVAVRAELDPAAALDEARRRGARIAFPRVADDQTPRLRFHLAADGDLQPGRFGIPEPSPGLPEVAAGDIDLMLVPGLAFDAAGHRLGTGGGYYDEWLEQAGASRPRVMGLAYDFQIVEACPTEPRDQAVDGVVTDARVLRAARGAG
jgi:5-formyltetrahydrofolate cyclo-ligase